ncbi:MAG: hypothetical protein VX228_16705, partial [Pseudomonadota bacterium]|nr:hypothetical protein [Pseudomonadota bacterium]
AAAAGAPSRRCAVPVAVQLERLRRHAHESAHVARFLAEPFLPAFLASEALRTLLAFPKCAKELSEAYGAAAQVAALLAAGASVATPQPTTAAAAAASAIGALATCEAHRAAIASSRGVAMLLRCLGEGSERSVQEPACAALRCVA